ncbi:hypothetical protein [Mesorhizobium wenxiniae]|uniref:hypothetical protein n=1 Tax=Mesorhizobium wenxiniae TaxID=2014805 RepID=UPI001FD8DAAA|nr:hypothetical protein [Mesorhizobium wenxiniae]
MKLAAKSDGGAFPADDGPAPFQPDAGAAVHQELERLFFLFERLENRAAIHDLPAALIGEADYKAIGWHRADIA